MFLGQRWTQGYGARSSEQTKDFAIEDSSGFKATDSFETDFTHTRSSEFAVQKQPADFAIEYSSGLKATDSFETDFTLTRSSDLAVQKQTKEFAIENSSGLKATDSLAQIPVGDCGFEEAQASRHQGAVSTADCSGETKASAVVESAVLFGEVALVCGRDFERTYFGTTSSGAVASASDCLSGPGNSAEGDADLDAETLMAEAIETPKPVSWSSAEV